MFATIMPQVFRTYENFISTLQSVYFDIIDPLTHAKTFQNLANSAFLWFGTRKSQVRILSPRPFEVGFARNGELFSLKKPNWDNEITLRFVSVNYLEMKKEPGVVNPGSFY